MDRCWTSSHRPTPPACGQTGRPYLAASSRIARFSLTPPTRAASICMMSSARAWISCLNTIRFCDVLAGGDLHRRDGTAGSRRGRGCRPGWSAPRPSTGPTAPAPGSRRSPASRPSAGWRRPRSARPGRPLRGPRQAPDVVGQVGADLQLDLGEAVRYGLLGQPGQLLVGVADPAGRGRVGRVAARSSSAIRVVAALACRAAGGRAPRPGSARRQVAEVDLRDEPLGGRVRE